MGVATLIYPTVPEPPACSPPTGLRERQRVARTEAILQGAFEIIAERGYAALTMEDLAAHIGISRPTLYHHFPNKDAIVLRAMVILVDQGSDLIRNIEPDLAPIQRLEKVARWMLRRRFSPTPAAFLKAKQAWLPLKSHSEYTAAFDRRAYEIQRIVDAGQSSGDIRAEIPSQLIVQMFLGMLFESHYEELITDDPTDADQAIDAIVSVFIEGIRTR